MFLVTGITYAGVVKWTANGNTICSATNSQEYPEICPDGTGGAIITWQDYRSGNYDIYCQRIDADGNIKWTTNGKTICSAIGAQEFPSLYPDGTGGAIITWQDYRSGTNYDIYAQRIDADGNIKWITNGNTICSAAGFQGNQEICHDGSGGAIIAWEDNRNGNYDIYAQCIDADGNVRWIANGNTICSNDTKTQEHLEICSDGSGGAVIVWDDYRSGSTADIYVQRIDLNGNVLWATNGNIISGATDAQEYPFLCSDGNGGAIIGWQDDRNGDYNVYSQKVDANGNVKWTINGETICSISNDQVQARLFPDGSGGALITWYDARSGNNDIYAQRIDANGNVKWTINGETICAAILNQAGQYICSDGSGGAIIVWKDGRQGNNDIYAQRVNSNATTKIVSNSTGGFVTADDNRTIVDVPAGALGVNMGIVISTNPLSSPIVVDTQGIQTANNSAGSHRLTGIIREFEVYNALTGEGISTNFTLPVTIRIPYPDSDENGVVDGTNILVDDIGLYFLDENTKKWEKVESETKRGDRQLVSSVRHFSTYSILMKSSLALSLKDAKVYPNPWRHGSGTAFDNPNIVFSGLTSQATIRIYTLFGELVFEGEETDGDGFYYWLGTNKSGKNLASGTYIYLITNLNNEKKTGKISIIR